jgi:hypothetical protein
MITIKRSDLVEFTTVELDDSDVDPAQATAVMAAAHTIPSYPVNSWELDGCKCVVSSVLDRPPPPQTPLWHVGIGIDVRVRGLIEHCDGRVGPIIEVVEE